MIVLERAVKLLLTTAALLGSLTADTESEGEGLPHIDAEHAEAQIFMDKIFKKYGKNGAITYEGFEHLLSSVGIGNLHITDHDIHDHFIQGEFLELHNYHNHTENLQNDSSTANSNQNTQSRDSQPTNESSEEKKKGRDKKKRALVNGIKMTEVAEKTLNERSEEESCMSAKEILTTFAIPSDHPINEGNFLHLCPAIVYQIDRHSCTNMPCDDIHDDIKSHLETYHHGDLTGNHGHTVTKESIPFWKISGKTWGFAILSVTVISLVGLVCVAIVPIMQRLFFNHLIQFLVALAIGSLTGDALLHLIPHSLVPHDSSSHTHPAEDNSHSQAVYKGLSVLVGIYLFFLAERGLQFITRYRERKRINKKTRRMSLSVDFKEGQVIDVSGMRSDVGERLSRPRKPSLMYEALGENADAQRYKTQLQGIDEDEETMHERESLQLHQISHSNESMSKGHGHSHGGQGHSHGGHGHSHEAPSSVSSIAWMVIMGDGLHNFCDGMAIGAAFASSITGGLSTSVAVFCHELPHELGDFAVLLRTGMSAKQALFYNLISSVLCFLGMLVGILAGNLESADSWIFGLAAGMFIYISLVDMLPEISTASKENFAESNESSCNWCYMVLQCLGISCGVIIMMVIALYEDQISIGLGDNSL